MTQPETARELLHRHGLPEDIIDGALCLHAQELAAQQRKAHDELRPYSHMGLPCKPEYECGARRVIDLIDPTRTPAAVSAAVAPPTQAAVLSPTERAMLTYALDQAQEHIWSRDGFTDEDQAAVDSLRRMADETATQTPAPDSTTLLELVRDFLDPDPCSFDHHGYCQAHAAGFGGEPLSCPHGRARKLLADLEQPAVGARQDGAEQ